MELPAKTVSSWTLSKEPSDFQNPLLKGVLLFGPDEGGINEFSRLAAGPSRERHEARTLRIDDVISCLSSGSLFGGATSVLLDAATDAQTEQIRTILETPFSDGARLVISGGELKASSKLRKLFASREDCLAVPLYLMRGAEILTAAKNRLSSDGLSLDPSAASLLVERLSGDRAFCARSCETLILHALGRGSSVVEASDVRAILDPVDEEALSAPLDHALSGQTAIAARGLEDRLSSGESFVAILRVFASRLFRLRELTASGQAPRDAVAKAKPPIFWADRDRTVRLLSSLTTAKIDRMICDLDRTEIMIIEQGVPSGLALSAMLVGFSAHRRWKDN